MPRLHPSSALMPAELEKQLTSSEGLRVSFEDRLLNAQRVLQTIDSYGWLPEAKWPEKPTEVYALTDDELLKYHQRKSDGEKLTKDENTALRLFGQWKADVVDLEQKLVSNLQLLVSCVAVFEQAQWPDQAEQVRQYIEQQYRCRLPEPCPDPWCDWTKRYVSWFTQNQELLPVHMRKMTKPPPARAEQARHPVAQQDLDWSDGSDLG